MFLGLLSILVGLAAIVGIVYPIPAVGLTSRRRSAQVLGLALIILIASVSFDASSGGSADTPTSAPAAATAKADSKKAGAIEAQPATTKPSTPAKTEPARPAEEYNFSVTNKSTGSVFKGKIMSDVGFAVLETNTAKTVGNSLFTETATSGATFVLAHVYIKNSQKDAITLDGSLLKLVYEGREYSYSSQAQTALEMAEMTEMIFLKQLNPELAIQAIVPFEVPDTINLNLAKFQFRGGMTGKTMTVPALPVIQ